MNQMAQTDRVVSSDCNILSVLVFAVFTDAASS